jgi:rhamnose utilization protein RhaD (predicted bifunctional aldolase and dehydrogenase)
MPNHQTLLKTITALSHAFGTPEHVKGGGGNTSCKDSRTLWVKPSGTTLSALEPDALVAMDRAALQALYGVEVPDEPTAREARVKELMAAAVRPESRGRPSVEAPLHDVLDGTYVVHTHSVLVNGLTCARQGREAARDLIPEALWIPYIDPGYTLCKAVRERVREATASGSTQPAVVLLGNHGIFVHGDSADQIEDAYARVLTAVAEHYRKAGVEATLHKGPTAASEEITAMTERLRALTEPGLKHVVYGGRFDVAEGPISPDHIVYAKAFPLVGEPTADGVASFRRRRGYDPLVYATGAGVFAVGPNEARARLTLDLAEDGALLKQLAAAFGGIVFLEDRERAFIENWEVESYRQEQLTR